MTIRAMNGPTPAAFAPGVLVVGIIMSATSVISFCWSSVNKLPVVFVDGELQLSKNTPIVVADNAPPIKKATLFTASLLFIFGC
ncbi:hypothetical protein D3C86_1662940 [compost metagenome]